MNRDLIIEMLFISLFSSVIAKELIQKIKDIFNLNKTFNRVISLIISFSIGFFFSLSFYDYNIINAIWIGLYTIIGAEELYQKLKDIIGMSKEE